jgi:hypothetical protein
MTFNMSTRVSQKNPMLNNTAYPQNQLEANTFGRSFNPTYCSYFGDGTGRDSYII